MTNTVPVLIEELEGAALKHVYFLLCIQPQRPKDNTIGFVMPHPDLAREMIKAAHTEGPTVQVPASLVGGE